MEKSAYIEKNKMFFDKWAHYYDIIEIIVKRVRKNIAKLIPTSRNLDILDVCTGTGSLALRFALQKNHQIMGLDLSEAMLACACRKNKFPNLKFVKGDATNLPFANSTKDIISISFGFHDMPHEIRLNSYKEMVRVIKPSGYIIIADYNRPTNNFLQVLYFKLTALYESEFYPSWYWNNYFKLMLNMYPCEIKINRTLLNHFVRILMIRPIKILE